ncbi:MAG: S41 family peptidase [Candidatus Eremiobacteraeota bacterium]|nr:S41 family peptidase [Candidatus Eremiobacteraeota bacterium]
MYLFKQVFRQALPMALLAVMLIALCFSPLPAAASHPLPMLVGEKVEKDEKEELLLPSYERYLKDPSKLGFSPDFRLFKTAYMYLKTQYVVAVEDAVLQKSCEKEVNRLLKTAKAAPSTSFKVTSFNSLEKEIEKFSPPMNNDLLWYAAIQGILLGLNDPYTIIMTPKEYTTLMEQMQSVSFGGIGIYVELDKEHNNALTVFEPIEGTPAFKAGLQSQDAIVFVDGVSTKGMALDMAVSKMRGPIGTTVVLTIKRPGVKQLLKFSLQRENIKIHSVSCKVLQGKYGYIRIRTFGEDTGDEFAKALNKLEEKKVKGLIVDLRNNGGGYIDAAVKVCSKFVEPGGVVVSVMGRTGAKNAYRSDGSQRVSLPLLVLVNKFSASASEITAGAIQDDGLGILMGTKTYGKGSVQQILPIPGGGAFKITTAHYYTPKGRNIDKKGIAPDVTVTMEPKQVGRKDDTQLRSAVLYLDKKQGQNL